MSSSEGASSSALDQLLNAAESLKSAEPVSLKRKLLKTLAKDSQDDDEASQALKKSKSEFQVPFGAVSFKDDDANSPECTRSSLVAPVELLGGPDVKTEPEFQISTYDEPTSIPTTSASEKVKEEPLEEFQVPQNGQQVTEVLKFSKLATKIFSDRLVIPWMPTSRDKGPKVPPPEITSTAGGSQMRPFQFRGSLRIVWACPFLQEVHGVILDKLYEKAVRCGITPSLNYAHVKQQRQPSASGVQNLPQDKCLMLILNPPNARRNLGGPKTRSPLPSSEQPVSSISPNPSYAVITTSPSGQTAGGASSEKTPGAAYIFARGASPTANIQHYNPQHPNGALRCFMPRREVDERVDILMCYMYGSLPIIGSDEINKRKAQLERLEAMPPVYHLNEVQLRDGYFRSFVAQLGVRPTLGDSFLGSYLQKLGDKAQVLFLHAHKQSALEQQSFFSNFFISNRAPVIFPAGRPVYWKEMGAFYPSIAQDKTGNLIIDTLYVWLFVDYGVNMLSQWQLVDITRSHIVDLPKLLHSLNHNAMPVHPWPTPESGDVFAKQKALLLLSMGFIPMACQPKYYCAYHDNYSWLLQTGYAKPIVSAPSSIQQGQLAMRMECLIWRLITPQLASQAFGREGVSTASVSERFSSLQKTLGKFFKGEEELKGVPKTLGAYSTNLMVKSLPDVFQSFKSFVPKQHIIDALLLANTIIPFTENEQVMGLFGANTISEEVIKTLAFRSKPGLAPAQRNVNYGPAQTAFMPIMRTHFAVPKP